MTVEGIDISTYQVTTPSLAGREFVIARASVGQYRDDRYAAHAADVRAQGKLLGAYHFVHKAVPASLQVGVFLGAARDADFLALDLEGADADATGRSVASAMIGQIHALGRKVGLYHSLSGYPSLGQDWRWVAYWSSTAPGIPWEFWQYRGSPLDLDRWHGDLASLQAFAHGQGGSEMPAIYQKDPITGTARVESGAKAVGKRIGPNGWEDVKTITGPATMHIDHRLHELTTTTGMDNGYHMADGPLAGLYVNSGQVTETLDPLPPAYGPSDLAAAKSAGYADAKSKAIAAVTAI